AVGMVPLPTRCQNVDHTRAGDGSDRVLTAPDAETIHHVRRTTATVTSTGHACRRTQRAFAYRRGSRLIGRGSVADPTAHHFLHFLYQVLVDVRDHFRDQ